MDKLCWNGHSFWTHSDRMSKCAHKRFIFLVLLPTVLRDFVPAVHAAILLLTYALRRLNGQVVSVQEARSLGIEPGCRVLVKTTIPNMTKELLRGLVMLEGSLPVATLNPAMHHIAHYGEQTARVGILMWFAMFAFERANRKYKNLVRNSRTPLTSLANNIRLDTGVRWLFFNPYI